MRFDSTAKGSEEVFYITIFNWMKSGNVSCKVGGFKARGRPTPKKRKITTGMTAIRADGRSLTSWSALLSRVWRRLPKRLKADTTGWAPSKSSPISQPTASATVAPSCHGKPLTPPFWCAKIRKQWAQMHLWHNEEFRETDVNMKERRPNVLNCTRKALYIRNDLLFWPQLNRRREEQIKLVILSNYPKDSWSIWVSLYNLWNTFLDKMRAVDFQAFTFIGSQSERNAITARME